MDNTTELLAQLSGLLTENSIGLERLTPRPRGGRLSGDPQQQVELVLDSLENSEVSNTSLIYGNGCFAVGRYAEAADVFQLIVADRTDGLVARFNLGLSYLRLRKAQEATLEFTQVIAQDPTLAEAYYQRGNAFDDLGEQDQALADYSQAIIANEDYLQSHRIGPHGFQRLPEPGCFPGRVE